MMTYTTSLLAAGILLAALLVPAPLRAETVARTWNEQNLDAIRTDFPNPAVHARNLFHTSVAMWDAWAACDPVAVGYVHNEDATWPGLAAARHAAVSFAAYRVLAHRYAGSVNGRTRAMTTRPTWR